MPTLPIAVLAVPENYFKVVKNEYYVPNTIQDGVAGISELENGEPNPMELLYSDSDIPEYPETTSTNSKNAYNITLSNGSHDNIQYGAETTYPTFIPAAL